MVNLMDTAAFKMNGKTVPVAAWKTNPTMNGKA
jgi:hypothetical protein